MFEQVFAGSKFANETTRALFKKKFQYTIQAHLHMLTQPVNPQPVRLAGG
jgi:hypothetical protein